MKRFGFAVLLLTGFLFQEATAQYSGPAVEACRAYAKKELERGGQKSDVVFDRDGALNIERYTRKAGSQFVSSVLAGNGAIVLSGAAAAELSFLCLLADEKRPVFFYWMPRQNAPSSVQCRRDGSKAPRPCLEHLLHVAEADLSQLYAVRFQETREKDVKAGNEASGNAFRRSNEDWRRYRDAECARQRDTAPAGLSPEDQQLSCVVDLTRRRALDLR